MANQNNNQQLEQLLKMASSRLGTDPAQLKNAAQNNNLGAMLGNMNPADAQKLQKVLSDKDAANKLLSTPQAQQLLKKILEGK